MIFFDQTRTIGQDANGKNVVWVSVYVDTAANLPAYNDYQSDGFILCMASEGRCIDTGDLYRLTSAGAWQISQAGTGTYTKTDIDTLLAAKQDVLTGSMTSLVNNLNTTFIDTVNSIFNVYKYGKICFADISLKTNSSALTGNDVITTTAFPAELRPPSTIYGTLTARDAGSWILANLVPAIVTIDVNGAASIRTGTAHISAEYIIGFISWLSST